MTPFNSRLNNWDPGSRFKSRAAARFAAWCTHHRQPFYYGPEVFGTGTYDYVPDFWLPRSKLIVDVRASITLHRLARIERLFTSPAFNPIEFLLVAMTPHLQPLAFAEAREDLQVIWCGEKLPRQRSWVINPNDTDPAGGALFGGFCYRCKAVNMSGRGSWACNGCGFYDGDRSHDRRLCFDAHGHWMPAKDVPPALDHWHLVSPTE